MQASRPRSARGLWRPQVWLPRASAAEQSPWAAPICFGGGALSCFVGGAVSCFTAGAISCCGGDALSDAAATRSRASPVSALWMRRNFDRSYGGAAIAQPRQAPLRRLRLRRRAPLLILGATLSVKTGAAITAGFGDALLGAGVLFGVTTSVRTGATPAIEYGGASFNSNGSGAGAGAAASFATGTSGRCRRGFFAVGSGTSNSGNAHCAFGCRRALPLERRHLLRGPALRAGSQRAEAPRAAVRSAARPIRVSATRCRSKFPELPLWMTALSATACFLPRSLLTAACGCDLACLSPLSSARRIFR